MCRHAPDAQRFAVVFHDVDRKPTAHDEIDRVRRFLFTIENLRGTDVFAFEIANKIGGSDAGAELRLKPGFETGKACIRIKIRLRE